MHQVDSPTQPRKASNPICDFERVDGRGLKASQLYSEYEKKGRPVVLTHLAQNWTAARELWTFENLERIYGHLPIGSEHMHNGPRTLWRFHNLSIRDVLTGDSAALIYDSHPMVNEMTKSTVVPLFKAFVKNCSLSIGRIHGSYAFSHTHEENWLAQVSGMKTWVVSPPGPSQHPSYPNPCDIPEAEFNAAAASRAMKRCVIFPGETFYLPSRWQHSVCNLGPTVAIGCIGAEYSAVARAVRTGNVSLFKGEHAPTKAKEKKAGIHKAVESGHQAMVEFFLDQGLDFLTPGSDLVASAAKAGHLPIVKLLVARRADPGKASPGSDYDFPIEAACSGGHTSVVEYLIEKGKPQPGIPLHRAAWSGHSSVVKLLVDQGWQADVKRRGGMTPALEAVEVASLDVLDYLIQQRADITARRDDGNGMMEAAAYRGHASTIKYLISKGLPVGESVLLQASHEGMPKVVEVLLEARADVMHEMQVGPNAPSMSSLDLACKRGHLPVASLLLQKGPGALKPHHLPEAAQAGSELLVELLLHRRANPSSAHPDGFQALHGAARSGHAAVVAALLKAGADRSARTRSGLQARDLARTGGHEEVLSALAEHGEL